MTEPTPGEPVPIDGGAPRYAPSHELPPHRYLPGITVRPEVERLEPTSVAPARLDEDEIFRYGVDLFNRSYFWEAHEAWEALWRACPEGPVRGGLQGLIQLAAANLKEALRVRGGAVRLAEAACRRLDAARSAGALPSIDLEDLTRRVMAHFAPLKKGVEPTVPHPGIRLARGGRLEG